PINANPSFPASFPTLLNSGQAISSPGGFSGASPMVPSPVLPPGSVPMHQAQGAHYFMVQEYVGGESLKDRIDRLNQPLEEREVLIYASQVLDTLNDLARQTPPVVHGDIKPANIIIGSKDQ